MCCGRGDAGWRRLRTDGRPERTWPLTAGLRVALLEAAVLAQRPVARAQRRWPTAASRTSSRVSARPCASRRRASPPTKTRSTAAGSGSAWRSATSPTSSPGTSATATSPSACWRRVRRCPASSPACSARADARAAQDRHALARRASRLQHAGNDAQRIARRDAGRGRDRTRAAGHAARREARSAAARSARRDGGVRLTDPLEQHLLDNSMIEQLSVDDLRNMTPAVWAQLDRLESPDRQDLRAHRHGCARSARSDGARQQGAERPVERAAGESCSRRSSRAIPRRRPSASRRFRRPTRAACRSRRSTA